MISEIALYRGDSFDPHYNLAVEQYLLESVKEGQCILYLWQNANTVVIGRNQNPWKECKTTLLEEEGGHLARRLSGGGAVYHDLGNLNFTFLVPQADYDLDRQLEVIRQAAALLGIKAEKTGRNDVTADGRKFSGNAFYKNGRQAYHHGTLLVDVDMSRMSRYLSPSKAKLQSKGVDSVRSRVVNLKELNPELTVDSLADALAQAFVNVYGGTLHTISKESLDSEAIEKLAQRNRSWEWNYGAKVAFTCSCEERFPWGGIEVSLQVDNGVIQQSKVYSDAMEWQIASALENALNGSRFTREDLELRITAADTDVNADLLSLLSQLGL